MQGPFVVPAAVALHASVSATAMAAAMGEDVSNMPQPFWSALERWILAVEMELLEKEVGSHVKLRATRCSETGA